MVKDRTGLALTTGTPRATVGIAWLASQPMVKFQYRHEDSAAALAPNWRRVLLVDAGMGMVVLALGVLSLAAWNQIVGWILVLLAVLYLFAVVGRYRTWKAHRAEAGLDG